MPTIRRPRRRSTPRPVELTLAPTPAPRPLGRAWINGREVAGPGQQVAHLSRSYD